MADGLTTLERAALQLGLAFEHLSAEIGSEDAVKAFARVELGIDVPDALTSLGIDPAALGAVTGAIDGIADALAQDPPDTTGLLTQAVLLAAVVTSAAANVRDAGAKAAAGLDPGFVTASNLVEELPRRILDWLMLIQLEERRPAFLQALRVLGVAVVEPVGPDPATFTTAHVNRKLNLEPLVTLLTDPRQWLRQAYGWGSSTSTLPTLLERLFDFAVARGLTTTLLPADVNRANTLAGGVIDLEQNPTPSELRIPVLHPQLTGRAVEAGLALVVLPAQAGAAEGLAVMPYADAALEADFPLDLAGQWAFTVKAGLDLQGGPAIIARPNQALRLILDVDGAGSAASGALEAQVHRLTSAPEIGLLTVDESGLFVTGFGLRAAALLQTGQPAELLVEVGLQEAHARLATDPSDGFLHTIIANVDVKFDLGFGFSTRKGAYFTGGAGLDYTLPLGQQLGPISIRQVTAKLAPAHSTAGQAPAIPLDLGLDLGFALGPFAVVVNGLGARLRIEERAGGNLGPLEVDLGFKPPTGLGLAIDSPAVRGGGFLSFDVDAGRYAGVFELTIVGTVSVKAIALITTKNPDGSAGFALLVIITAEGFTPVPLGFGFELTGIGGLLALNRTVNADAVRDGLRDGVVDSVLFPKDPVRNATRILSTLDRIFPLAHDRLVIGPLAEIGWGSPPIVKIRLALLLEIPKPIRAILLAALSALLPDEQHAVVELHVDAVGVLDLGRGELSLDASLHDSRILRAVLSGDMALRLNWGDAPAFLLSVGGFHPRYVPPAGLRPLNRLSLSLSSGDPSVRLECYFAITSNTVQFGARVTLSAQIAGFGVAGGGAFDALIQWSPFALDISMQAWVKITAGGATLLSATITAEISGPQPWHVTGTASVSLLFFSVSVHIDFTIGASAAPPPVDTVDLAAEIWAAVGPASAWEASLPAAVSGGATLATPSGAPADTLLIHPLATLSVRQKIAPLQTPISRVGARLPQDGTRTYHLDVTAPTGVSAGPLNDLFARAQYQDVSDDAKLAAASFEPLPAGVTLTPTHASDTATNGVIATDLTFETLDVTSFDTPATSTGTTPALAITALTNSHPNLTTLHAAGQAPAR